MNFIRNVGAMQFLWHDMAKEEDSKAVNDLLRSILAPNRYSEPHNQHQNPTECKILDVKSGTCTVMDRTGTPSKWWLLCMIYVIHVMNHIALRSLNWETPINNALGITPDITPLMLYSWWEPVYYYDPDVPFPESREKLGRFAGFVDNVGDAFCFKVVTVDTEEVIYHSVLRSAITSTNSNLRPSNITPSNNTNDDNFVPSTPVNGETSVLSNLLTPSQSELMPIPNDLKKNANEIPLQLTLNGNENNTDIPESLSTTFFDHDNLIGKTFLHKHEDDGTIHRAEVIKRIETADDVADQYLVKIGEDRDEVLNYNTVIDSLNKQIERELNDQESVYSFKNILEHRKKGSSYEVLVEWECGETTWEPLAVMRHDDPITVAKYAKENDLLNEPGWKRLRNYVKTVKCMNKNLKQARLFAARTMIKYKFGVKIP